MTQIPAKVSFSYFVVACVSTPLHEFWSLQIRCSFDIIIFYHRFEIRQTMLYFTNLKPTDGDKIGRKKNKNYKRTNFDNNIFENHYKRIALSFLKIVRCTFNEHRMGKNLFG